MGTNSSNNTNNNNNNNTNNSTSTHNKTNKRQDVYSRVQKQKAIQEQQQVRYMQEREDFNEEWESREFAPVDKHDKKHMDRVADKYKQMTEQEQVDQQQH